MKKLLALSVLVAASSGAYAQLSYSTGGSYLSSILDNDVPSFSSGLEDALISANTPGNLTATFLGKEAAHQNLFSLGALNLLNTAAVGTSGVAAVGAGALAFGFKDNADGTTTPNGGNTPTTTAGSYVIFGTRDQSGAWTPLTSYGGANYDLIIGWNDGYKADADFDDHVIGLTLAPVPEPGTYAMLSAGLLALGFIARRRRVS